MSQNCKSACSLSGQDNVEQGRLVLCLYILVKIKEHHLKSIQYIYIMVTMKVVNIINQVVHCRGQT